MRRVPLYYAADLPPWLRMTLRRRYGHPLRSRWDDAISEVWEWLYDHNRPLARRIKVWQGRFHSMFRKIGSVRCLVVGHKSTAVFRSYTDESSGPALICARCHKTIAEGPRVPRWEERQAAAGRTP